MTLVSEFNLLSKYILRSPKLLKFLCASNLFLSQHIHQASTFLTSFCSRLPICWMMTTSMVRLKPLRGLRLSKGLFPIRNHRRILTWMLGRLNSKIIIIVLVAYDAARYCNTSRGLRWCSVFCKGAGHYPIARLLLTLPSIVVRSHILYTTTPCFLNCLVIFRH